LSAQRLLNELHKQLSPKQFEKFLSILLGEMGFSDVTITGRSGDNGIDLQATWTETNVPGLEVDLAFKIQAKRFTPKSSLSPRYVRELRGTLRSGEWGLLITTARSSSKTRQDGLADDARRISIIDGQSLIELCKKYKVGIRTDYQIDLSALDTEEMAPEVSEISEKTTGEMLNESLHEEFLRFGNSPIYQSKSRVVIARASKRYDRRDTNYWYSTKAKDLDRVKKYNVTHFAFVCSDRGVVLIPTSVMLQEIARENLLSSTTKEGQLIHYHIFFYEKNSSIYWKLRSESRNVGKFWFAL
jgi:hypothetical protein